MDVPGVTDSPTPEEDHQPTLTLRESPRDSSRLSQLSSSIDRYFQIKFRGSTLTTEILAGVSTFFAVSYAIVLNPTLLCPGGPNDPDGDTRWPSVFVATCFSTIFANVLMAMAANMPFALGPGITWMTQLSDLIFSGDDDNTWSFDNGMALCFVYSVIVLFLCFFPAGRDSAGTTSRCGRNFSRAFRPAL
jgi:xanthine/uracil/vitamin C permease (AzgA family)